MIAEKTQEQRTLADRLAGVSRGASDGWTLEQCQAAAQKQGWKPFTLQVWVNPTSLQAMFGEVARWETWTIWGKSLSDAKKRNLDD